MPVFFVSTPLMLERRCESEAAVAELINEYMDGKDGASLDRVTVVELPLFADSSRRQRAPTDFWP